MRQLDRVLAAAAGVPWAILPEKGEAIAAVLTRAAAGEPADPGVLAALAAARKEAPRRTPGKRVGLVPVYGTLTQRADWMAEWSGGTSCEQVARQVTALAADPQVDVIVLDVDSPGGSVYGVAEAGQAIAAAGKAKKVVAVANSVAASGAYWLAAQSTELCVTPGGEVGSIGVFMMHTDKSAMLAGAGVTVTVLKAGERKASGHPYSPLDDTARAELQGGVDDYYALFVKAVAAGRNVSQAAVREGFGRGGMVRAEQAVKEGMADRVATLDDVLGRYGATAADFRPGNRSASADVGLEVRRRRLRGI